MIINNCEYKFTPCIFEWIYLAREESDIYGVNVYQTSDAIMSAQLKAWDSVMKDFRKDPLFDKIVKSQQAYAKKVMKYLFMNQPNYRLAYEQTFGDPVKVKI